MRTLIWISVWILVVKADDRCDCHDVPSCRCVDLNCNCKQIAVPPCVCKIPPKNEFDQCHQDCVPSCLGACLITNLPQTCEQTCTSACTMTCPEKLKKNLLTASLTDSCNNDCLADCLLSSDPLKNNFIGGTAKIQCESACRTGCVRAVNESVTNLPENSILFAVAEADVKQATFSRAACSQHCHFSCTDRCTKTGMPKEVCRPTCDAFCNEKCSVAEQPVPNSVCVKACQPACDRACVMDKTLDMVFGFVDTAKDLSGAVMPAIDQLMTKAENKGLFGGENANKVNNDREVYAEIARQVNENNKMMAQQAVPEAVTTTGTTTTTTETPTTSAPTSPTTTTEPRPVLMTLPPRPRAFHAFNCRPACDASCNKQCIALQRPGLNCTRLCDRTCDVHCPTTGIAAQSPTVFHSLNPSWCRDQLTLKCGALCRSPECADICHAAARFLCTRSAECNNVCQKTCTQQCLIRDKGFAQCEPICAESCSRECRLSNEIRLECQGNCLNTCGDKCDATSPTEPLKAQCTTNCPQLCHSVCYE
uniref:Uncharacterized protein n=1 Tax=Panagrellus redivivus TaxID=6233 RepID=A0A7E5A116_PANRE